MTINSITTTQSNISDVAIITATTTYNGSLSGTTFTADGTGYGTTSCEGDAPTCIGAPPSPTITLDLSFTSCTDAPFCTYFTGGSFSSGSVFSVDTLLGGTWEISGYQLDGTVSVATINTLSSVPIPAAAWLFGSALIGLAAIKRKK